jgi:hypothetical protein
MMGDGWQMVLRRDKVPRFGGSVKGVDNPADEDDRVDSEMTQDTRSSEVKK